MEGDQLNVIISYEQKLKSDDVKIEPENFEQEMTTIWSFKDRGDLATHNPSYRGNWSPYIPRKILLRY